MGRVVAGELDTEHLTDNLTPHPIVWLENDGYPVTEVESYNVVSLKDGDNTSYRPRRIRTFAVNPVLADAVEDETEVFVCHCSDFVHRKMCDTREDETPTDIEDCKHIDKIRPKSERAQNDESQQQLAAGDTQ